MPRIRIESPQDPRIAPYANLRDRELRARRGRFIAEGELVVRRLLESRYAVESLLVAESQLARIDAPTSVPVYYGASETLEAIAGFPFHRGILGCGIRPAASDWSARVPPPANAAVAVLCSAVRDAENLGVILRNCAAFGVDFVLIGDQSIDPFTRRVLRVSMATALKLNICLSADLNVDLRRLRHDFGFHCAATVLDPNATPLAVARRPRRLALVFGNELTGVAADTRLQCESQVTIPMSLETDSLNVAVASGIFLYHFRTCQETTGELR